MDIFPEQALVRYHLAAGEDPEERGRRGGLVFARIGVSIEPSPGPSSSTRRRRGWAKRRSSPRGSEDPIEVYSDLFRYLGVLQPGAGDTSRRTRANDHLVVPANFLDRWFTKFQHKFRRDPDFLTRQTEKA